MAPSLQLPCVPQCPDERGGHHEGACHIAMMASVTDYPATGELMLTGAGQAADRPCAAS